ncbi:hypothetical protein N9A88_03405 [Akkermansiaceae bacterium]|nr:hypothetical protein [Akkermansiaceae bacterium]MDB4418365.1 hypothetical protein [Akkermansiaceae bacterium]
MEGGSFGHGLSGSPVFSVRLGTVVGVLQTANNKTKATIGGFELGLLDGTLTPSLNRGSG